MPNDKQTVTNDEERDSVEPEMANRPIGVTSQPIIDVAAERIASQDGVGGPVGKFSKTKKAIKPFLSHVLTEDMSETGANMVARAVMRVGDIVDGTVDTIRRAKDDVSVVYDVGHDIVSRLATMTEVMADIANDGMAEDAADGLASTILWVDEGYMSAIRTCGYEKAESMSVTMRRIFDSSWKWLWNNAMSVNVPKPLSQGRTGKTLANEFMEELPAADPNVGEGIRNVIAAAERIAKGWDGMSLANMSSKEMERIAILLGAFSRGTISWPSDYPNRPLLMPAGIDVDNWPNEQYWDFLAGIGNKDIQGARKEVSQGEGDAESESQVFYTVKTNEEMGLPFAAWTQDCHEASKRLSAWAQMMGDDPSATLVMSLMDTEDREHLLQRTREAWSWLGNFVLDMRI